MIQLNYRDSRPYYEQLADNIRYLILTNSLQKNERLPSVREMASQLAINPNTIQRAYHELENEGYIYTVSGRGSFISEEIPDNSPRITTLLQRYQAIAEELFFLGIEKNTLIEHLQQLYDRVLTRKDTKL